MRKNEKTKTIIVDYKTVCDLDEFFSKTNNQIYTAIIESINVGIDKNSPFVVPFIIKKADSNISCLLNLEKKKWESILEKIQSKLMEEEQYESIANIKVVLTKLKLNHENKSILSSKNNFRSGKRQRESSENSGVLPCSGSIMS